MSDGAFDDFVFALGAPDTEELLHREVEFSCASAQPGYARRGLRTYRVDDAGPDWGRDLAFAHVTGASLGHVASLDEVEAIVRTHSIATVHVFARPEVIDVRTTKASRGFGSTSEQRVFETRAALGTLRLDAVPSDGDLVLDLIIDDRKDGTPGYFVGVHRHAPGLGRDPGGVLPVAAPSGAPSRAYSKVVEVFRWVGASPTHTDHVIELGAAPGGITHALLETGASVTAIDPGALDPRLVSIAGDRLEVVVAPAGAYPLESIKPGTTWLVSDMNLAPPVALRYIERIVRAAPSIRRAVVTLKVNDDLVLARLPAFRRRFLELGFSRAWLRQLPSNRREVMAFAER